MELARRLEETELDAVYSSDLQRARETAEIVARARASLCRDDARLPRGRRRLVVGPDARRGGSALPGALRPLASGGRGLGRRRDLRAAGRARRPGDPADRRAERGPRGRPRRNHPSGARRRARPRRPLVPPDPARRAERDALGGLRRGRRLTELCRTEDLDEFLLRDQERRREAALRPPTPAG